MIYLDYASATPVDKKVLKEFNNVYLKYYANPNSQHPLGQEAKERLDEMTENIAKMLGVLPEEIIYTSGATESNNLVIKGVAQRYKNFGKHILLSSLEHQSLIAPATKLQEQGFEVELIPVDKNGLVDLKELKKKLRDDTILVSVTSIDSELGIIQQEIAIKELLKEHKHCIFHTDASQIIGKIRLNPEPADLITINPHKFYGLNGTGILIKKKNIELAPLIEGGRSTTPYRSGTPSLAAVASINKALEESIYNLPKRIKKVNKLNEMILNKMQEYSKVHINSTEDSVKEIINLSIEGVDAKKIVEYFGKNNICISAKTSCCPVDAPSKLVYALTKDNNLAKSSIRISLSHLTTYQEIEEFLQIFDKGYKEQFNGKV